MLSQFGSGCRVMLYIFQVLSRQWPYDSQPLPNPGGRVHSFHTQKGTRAPPVTLIDDILRNYLKYMSFKPVSITSLTKSFWCKNKKLVTSSTSKKFTDCSTLRMLTHLYYISWFLQKKDCFLLISLIPSEFLSPLSPHAPVFPPHPFRFGHPTCGLH